MNFSDLIYRIKSIKLGLIEKEIFEAPEFSLGAIEQIQKRLYDTGRTASLIELHTDFSKTAKYRGAMGFYSRNTERIKKGIPQPINRVTLYFSGVFYDSFKISANTKSFHISANFKKGKSEISDNFLDTLEKKDFEKEILSLSEEEKKYFIKSHIRPSLITSLKNSL